eukprot:2152050-Rhodomonas_salina.1
MTLDARATRQHSTRISLQHCGDSMTINDDDARLCHPSQCATTMFIVTLDYDNAMMLDNARQRS